MNRRRWNYKIKNNVVVCIFKNRQDTVRSNLCNYISIIHNTQEKYTQFSTIIHSIFLHHYPFRITTNLASTRTSFTKTYTKLTWYPACSPHLSSSLRLLRE